MATQGKQSKAAGRKKQPAAAKQTSQAKNTVHNPPLDGASATDGSEADKQASSAKPPENSASPGAPGADNKPGAGKAAAAPTGTEEKPKVPAVKASDGKKPDAGNAERDVITVQTVRGKASHRRAGRRFSRQPETLALADLDDAQRAALKADPALIVKGLE